MPFGFYGDSTLTQGWQPEPDTRGTWSILASCLATMSLCIWSSLHLNMPGFDDKAWHIVLRKAGWLVCGLFAPELVVWAALQQWREARSLTPSMQEHLGESNSSETASESTRDLESGVAASSGKLKVPSRHPWTIVHSHYLLMGGFAFDASFSPQPYLPSGVRQLKLKPDATVFLASLDPRLIPNLSKEQISDKSKANSLAKTVVCLQASWFCVQCVVRLSQGIGTSLLELNTFAHAICALLIFLLWWDKPLDVGQPSIIQAEGVAELCAAMVVTDAMTCKGRQWKFRYKHRTQAGYELVRRIPLRPFLTPRNNSKEDRSPYESEDSRIYLSQLLPKSYEIKNTRSPPVERNDIKSMKWFEIGDITRPFSFDVENNAVPGELKEVRPIVFMGLTAYDEEFLRIAARGLEKYKSLPKGSTTLLGRRINEWPPLGSADNYGVYIHSSSLLVGLLIAGLAYGGMHLLAWSAPFASNAEAILWRASALILVVSGLVLGLTQVFDQTKEGSFCYDMFAGLAYALCFFFLLLYVLARLFLVVECFVQLAYLPEKVFLTPKLTKYWPHIA